MNPRIHRALRALDVDAMRPEFMRMLGNPAQEPGKGDPILAGMHKARIMAGRAFTSAERQASAQWLRANGYVVPGAK